MEFDYRGYGRCAVCGRPVYPSGDNKVCTGPNPAYAKLPGQPSGLYEYRCREHRAAASWVSADTSVEVD